MNTLAMLASLAKRAAKQEGRLIINTRWHEY